MGILVLIALVIISDHSQNIAPEKSGKPQTSSKRIVIPDLPSKPKAKLRIEEADTSLNRRLPNETMIRRAMLNGGGKLTVKNGLDRDAALKVIDKRKNVCIAYFYARARSNATVKEIEDGDYRLLFVTGVDWDQGRGCFTREVAFSEFDRSMLYETREQVRDEGVFEEYTIIEVTLHRVSGGNVRTSKMSPEDFNKY